LRTLYQSPSPGEQEQLPLIFLPLVIVRIFRMWMRNKRREKERVGKQKQLEDKANLFIFLFRCLLHKLPQQSVQRWCSVSP
jgi:hypothetical protein